MPIITRIQSQNIPNVVLTFICLRKLTLLSVDKVDTISQTSAAMAVNWFFTGAQSYLCKNEQSLTTFFHLFLKANCSTRSAQTLDQCCYMMRALPRKIKIFQVWIRIPARVL